MIDLSFFFFNKSLKLTWIKKINPWNLITMDSGKVMGDPLKKYGSRNILTSNLNVRDTLGVTRVSNAFSRVLLEIWGEIKFENQIVSEEHFLDQP